jgi:TP901 family phage tail tape measure protein
MADRSLRLEIVIDDQGGEAKLRLLDQGVKAVEGSAATAAGVVAGFNAKITGSGTAAEQSAAMLRTYQTQLTAAGSAALTAGGLLTAGLTVPLAAVGYGSIKAAMDFETAFAGVRKTVTGTPEELNQINSQLRDMAKTTPMSAAGLAAIAETAGQMGVSKAVIADFTKTIVDIAAATHLTADQAATSFAQLAIVTHMPQEQFRNLGSAVVALGNFGSSTEQQMLDMGQRISAAGGAVGMTAPQVLGLANAFSSVGLNAELGGTAISRVIIQMASDVESGGGHLQTFARVAGLSAADFKEKFGRDAAGAFAAFIQGLNNSERNGGSLINVINELGFKSVQLRNAMMSAAQAGDMVVESLDKGVAAFNANTEVNRASEERYKTAANQLKIFQNNLNDIGITIGKVLTPKLTEFVGQLGPIVQVVDNLAKAFEGADKGTQLFIIGAGLLLSSLGPILAALGSVALIGGQVATLLIAFPAIGVGVSAAFTAISTSVAGFALGVSGLIALVGGLAYGLTRLVDIASGNKLSGWISATEDLAVKTQTAAASQDAINLAWERTGITAKTGAEALKLNTEWLKQNADWAKQDADAAKNLAKVHAEAKEPLTQLSAETIKAANALFAHRASLTEVMKALEAKGLVDKADIDLVRAQQDVWKASDAIAKRLAKAIDDQRFAQIPLTAAQVEHLHALEKLKLGEADIAALMGIHTVQIGVQIAKDKEAADMITLKRSIEKTALADSAKEYDAWQAHVSKLADLLGKQMIDGAVAVAKAQRDTADLTAKATLSSYDYQARVIEQWAEAAKRTFDQTGQDHTAFYAEIDEQARLKLENIAHNWDALKRASINALQDTADEAAFQYAYMLAHDDEYTTRAIKNAKKRADAAQNEADGNVTNSHKLTDVLGLVDQAGQALGGTFGKTVSFAAGAISSIAKGFEQGGPWGAVIAGIGVAIKGLTQLFSGGEEAAKVNKPRQQFIDAAGGLAALNAEVMKATGSISLVQDLLNAKTEAAYKKAVDAITSALKAFDAALADAKKALEGVSAALSTQTSLTPALEAALKKAYDAKTPQDYTLALAGVQKILDDQKQGAADLKDAMDKYGLSWTDMGEKAKQAHMDDLARDLIKDFNTLRQSGMNVNVQMEHMGPTLSKFVQDAKEAGTEVPESMRGILQTAIDAGTLYDKNGKQIKSMQDIGVTFGTTMQETMEKVGTAVDKLAKVIDTLAGALNAVPKAVTTVVTTEFREVRGGDGGDAATAAMGGRVTASGVQYLAGGGNVLRMMPRGSDTVPAMLTPGEGIVTKRGMQSLGDAGLSAINRGQGAQTSAPGLTISIGNITVGSGVQDEHALGAAVSSAVIARMRGRGVRFSGSRNGKRVA